jgi:putative ABC transport system permease protein
MLNNYFKIAWRNLMKNKVFSFINIFGLAVGLASCMLILLYLFNELTYDSYHDNASRLYQVGTVFNFSGKEQRYPAVPAIMAQNMMRDFPDIEQSARIMTFNFFGEYQNLLQYIQPDGRVRSFYEPKGCAADPTFFKLFSYHFLEGNSASALNKPNTVVISKEIADKLFTGQPALNKLIHISSGLNGDHDFLVSGVFEPNSKPSHIDGQFFISLYGGSIEDRMKRDGNNMTFDNLYTTYLLLKPFTDEKKLESRFPAFIDKYAGKDLKEAGFSRLAFLLPIREIHLHANMMEMTPSGNVIYLYILGSTAIFILLIACINFMNLSTARSSRRSSEVGIRKVLGAIKSRLIRQFLGESLLMSLIAFAFAIGIMHLSLPAFERVSGHHLDFSFLSYINMLAFFLALSLLTGLLAGIYPALYLSSFSPVKVLKGRFSNSLAAVSVRKGLVIFQFVISIILIIATMVISGQMQHLRSADLGFAKDHQIVIPIQSQRAKSIYPLFKKELTNNKWVLSVGASAYYPGISNPSSDNFHKEGQQVNAGQDLKLNHVDESFLQTLEIKAVAGRLFSKAFVASDTIDRVIINENAAKRIGFSSPEAAIGKKIFNVYKGKFYSSEIIGVVKDFHFEDLHSPITAYGFYLNNSNYYNYAIIHAGNADIAELIKSIESTWHTLNPSEPLIYSFMDQDFQKNYMSENRLSSIINYFTIIAIIISCLGLFGLATFSAEQRNKEISVRKVLGASVAGIVKLLSKEFLMLVLIAVLIASPIAWFIMNRWLQYFTSRVSINWSIFALTATLALLIAFTTIGFQTIRAALASPVKHLKNQ